MQHLRRHQRLQLSPGEGVTESVRARKGPDHITKTDPATGVKAGAKVELIVGNQRIAATHLRRIPGGIEAELAGAALTSLLDASFGGTEIAVLGGDLDHHALDVADIRMAGATTTITLLSAGAVTLH